jgi:hypothetical protein
MQDGGDASFVWVDLSFFPRQHGTSCRIQSENVELHSGESLDRVERARHTMCLLARSMQPKAQQHGHVIAYP